MKKCSAKIGAPNRSMVTRKPMANQVSALSGANSISIPISGLVATSTLILDAKRSGESAMVVSNDVARSRTVSPLKNALKLSTYAAVSEIGRPIR